MKTTYLVPVQRLRSSFRVEGGNGTCLGGGHCVKQKEGDIHASYSADKIVEKKSVEPETDTDEDFDVCACGAPINEDGWDGKCASCADKAWEDDEPEAEPETLTLVSPGNFPMTQLSLFGWGQ